LGFGQFDVVEMLIMMFTVEIVTPPLLGKEGREQESGKVVVS
jgi:hypothetical protein